MTDSATDLETPGRTFRIETPGDWMIVDAAAIAEWEGGSEDYPRSLQLAFEYIQLSARMLVEEDILAAFLVSRDSDEALATMTVVPVTAGTVGERPPLEELVRENPPADALGETFEVTTTTFGAATVVRAECLRRSVLELPSTDAVSLAVEYFWEVPDSDDLLVASFATPNAGDPEPYRELFESIASTVVFD